jgi:hypothetical protein
VSGDGAAGGPVDELATALFALDVQKLSTGLVTRHITDVVVKWALARGWTPRVEARVEAVTLAGGRRLGYVDVLVHRPGEPDLAVEIDSGDKPWSVDKLQYAAAAGMQAIWIRWGDQEWAGVYDEVDVIQLWLTKRPLRRQPTNQMPIW